MAVVTFALPKPGLEHGNADAWKQSAVFRQTQSKISMSFTVSQKDLPSVIISNSVN